MAHFAKLGTGNVVISVIAVHNNELLDINEVESEQKGIDFLNRTFNQSDDIWKQTSFNTREGKHYTNGVLSADQSKAFRKNYAGIGFFYDESRDCFIPPKVFSSFILNEEKGIWVPPVPYPTDSYRYKWNETNLDWVKVDI
jgi:hypothetical protein